MAIAITRFFRGFSRRLWPVGPIFTKELRVSSRQRRHYLMRSAYLAVLTVFVVLVWLSVVHVREGGAFHIARMGKVGKQVISSIIWFQFVAAQLLAVILMSTSISDEIYRGTLGVLMTTPLTCFQIVAGKLFSRLLQVLVLLAISFPLLAIVRVFGGVPWSYVVAGLCITITTAVFVGALTMIFSIRLRRPYVIVLASLGAHVAFNVVLSAVLALSCLGFFLVFIVNPYVVLWMLTMHLFEPTGPAVLSYVYPAHCLLMLAASVGVLFVCAHMLRKTASKQLTGEALVPLFAAPTVPFPRPLPVLSGRAGLVSPPVPPEPPPTLARLAEADAPPLPAAAPGPLTGPPPLPSEPPPMPAGPPPVPPGPPRPPRVQYPASVPRPPAAIRRITGSPILWKEFHKPVLGGPTVRTVVLAVAGVVLLMTYLFMLPFHALSQHQVQAGFVSVYLVIAMAWTCLLAATTIAPEKESRCWPLLMTTALSDDHILLGKAAGVLRRSLPAWLLLAAHVNFFTIIGIVHPLALLHVFAVAAAMIVFLLGMGAYFSARFQRTASAVVASLAVPLVLWVALPGVAEMIAQAMRLYGPTTLTFQLAANPVVQVITAVEGAAGDFPAEPWTALTYIWPWGRLGAGATTHIILVSSLIYAGLGGLFALAAKRSFRRRVF